MGRVTIPFHPDNLAFVVEVQVNNTAAVRAKLAQEGKPVPEPMTIQALVDTGASTCAATDRLIAELCLPSRSDETREIMTAGGAIQSRQYFAELHLTEAPDIRVGYTTLCRYDFTGAPFDFIIGMSALMRWNFSYARVEQKLTIQFP